MSPSLLHALPRAQPGRAEPVQAEPVQAEPVQAEPVQAEPVQAEPVQAEPGPVSRLDVSSPPSSGWIVVTLGMLLLLSTGCASAPPGEPADSAVSDTAAEAASAAAAEDAMSSEDTAETAESETTGEPCAGGVIKDDGATDLGYSFVPSSTEAFYLQAFHSDELPSRELDAVCLCFFQKPGGEDADFEVVFHGDGGGGPALEPYARVPATATELGQGKNDARLYEIDVSGITVPEGPFYVGARWNPSQEVRLFICADHSPETERVEAFYKDDRQQGWRSVFRTADPTFTNHRSLLVRLRAAEPGE